MPYLPYLVWSLIGGGVVYGVKVMNDEGQETLKAAKDVFDSSATHSSNLRDIAIAGAVVAGLYIVAHYSAPLLKR